MGDLGQVGQNFWPGALVVCGGIRGVAVLVEHHPVGVLVGQLLGHRHRGVGSTLGRRIADLRAVSSRSCLRSIEVFSGITQIMR